MVARKFLEAAQTDNVKRGIRSILADPNTGQQRPSRQGTQDTVQKVSLARWPQADTLSVPASGLFLLVKAASC
ncbi:uncharacterized protein ColSpa_09185 [Colletotrichum spaethianum]|uniref:Uncharacterized protein n=1 Tax=Colletotrichum spaethianum TaxID=700344 RepID=A0AA37UJ25_9PEZI|nr:uncharacterized protein ColSpa_09185 [Colletotrichum spaethianum]GKT49004.1 hypothetical protein ColSpa_09185 [Colletotrichum spaethianum]